jgi:hypothetical protein
MKFCKWFLIVAIAITLGCEEKVSQTNNFICSTKLDSCVLELYQIDTQTVNASNKSAITSKGNMLIDLNNPLYQTFTFNSDATTIKKDKKNFSYPARTFKIVNNYFYYGDDISIINQCKDSSIILYAELPGQTPSTLRLEWHYYRKK